MRMRLGLGIGLAVGYVLGARAGRERYEELKTAAGRVADNPVVRSATDLVHRKAEQAEQAVADKIAEVQESVGTPVEDARSADQLDDVEESASLDEAATAIGEAWADSNEGKE